MKSVPVVLLGLVAFWVASDFVYSRVVAWRLGRWESSITRGAGGVQAGAAAYEIGTGETALLLVHGIGDSPRQWHKMAPKLADEALTVRVMRLPGFGEPIDRYARITKEEWIGEVRRELADLRKRHARVIVVAHSLGAAVAVAALLEDPAAADGAVLIAPLIDVSNRRSPVLSTRAWHEFSKRAFLFTKITETPFPIDARDPAERDHPGRSKFTPRVVFDEVFGLLDGNRDRLRELATPLVVIVAEDDRVVDNAAAVRLFREAAARERLLGVPGGHAIPVDTGWEKLVPEIARFARKEEPTGRAGASRH
jgi:pimeloyl-ACP methyl ester carboxylesterase